MVTAQDHLRSVDPQYSVGDGADTITDFNFGNSGTLTDVSAANNDFINLSTYYDHLGELWGDQADDGILNQSNATDLLGNAVDYSDNTQFALGDSLTFTGATAGASFFTAENTGVVCFVEGTRILTTRGSIPVEDLALGDLVQTADYGPQPVLWIGRRHLSRKDLAERPEMAPILIPAGLLGNTVDVRISPLHGVLLGPDQGLKEEAFARAKHLAELPGGVRQAKGTRSVRYVHLLLPQHAVIYAEGMPTESFYPGFEALLTLQSKALARLQRILPEVAQKHAIQCYGRTARPFLKRREVRDLGCGGKLKRLRGQLLAIGKMHI